MTSPWPNGARVAVMLTFDFDAESGWLARDPSHKDRPGVISQGRYGPNVGVPRLLDLLRVEQVPATFFIPGWVVEQYTEKAKMIRDAGYEIGMGALERVLGLKPSGYRAPSWDLTPLTLSLVKQHGMLYSSNMMDNVFPYVHPGTSIVELPVQWTLDDAPFFMFHPTFLNRPMNKIGR